VPKFHDHSIIDIGNVKVENLETAIRLVINHAENRNFLLRGGGKCRDQIADAWLECARELQGCLSQWQNHQNKHVELGSNFGGSTYDPTCIYCIKG
jgi:hypothetical protein